MARVARSHSTRSAASLLVSIMFSALALLLAVAGSIPAATVCALVCLVGASLVLSACGRGLDSCRDRLRVGLRGGLVLGFVCWLGAGSTPSLAELAGVMTLAHLNSAPGALHA